MTETSRGPDLFAATRFVQAGRLTEATALLQRLLRGEPEDVAHDTGGLPPSAKTALIDLTPETLEVAEQWRKPPAVKAVGTGIGNLPSLGSAVTAQSAMPEALRSFLQRFNGSGLEAGLDGLTGLAIRRRHRKPCRTAPDFLRDPTATKPAAAPTSSTCPAPITGRHCRWWSCCTAAPSRPTTSPPARE